MTNPYKEYKDTFRSSLPVGMTYDSTTSRFVVNEKRFVSPWVAKWYLKYLQKFGYIVDPTFKTSSGNVSIPGFSVNSVFPRTVNSSGEVVLPQITSFGSSEPITSFEGEATLPAFLSSGISERTVTSSGVVSIPSVTSSGVSERTVNGSGSIELGSFVTSGTAAVDTTAPTASSISAGTQDSNGDVEVTVTSLDEDSTLYWVLVPNGDGTPSAAQVVAGQNSAGGSPSDSGNQAVTTTGGPYNLALTTGLDASYDLHAVFQDAAGNNSTVYSDNAISIDTTGPTFSSAEIGTTDATSLIVTMSETLGGTTSTGDWTVNVNGSPVSLTSALIVGSTVDITLTSAVSNGDTVTVAYSGSTVTDDKSNAAATFSAQSVTNNVSSAAGFTVSRLLTTPYTVAFGGEASSTTSNVTPTGGRPVVVVVHGYAESSMAPFTPDTFTFGGAAFDSTYSEVQNRAGTYVGIVETPSTSSQNVVFTMDVNGVRAAIIEILEIDGAATSGTVGADSSLSQLDSTVGNLSLTTTAANSLALYCATRQYDSVAMTISGTDDSISATESGATNSSYNCIGRIAWEEVASAGTATATVSAPNDGTKMLSVVNLEIKS